jgi:hypothetical protein
MRKDAHSGGLQLKQKGGEGGTRTNVLFDERKR